MDGHQKIPSGFFSHYLSILSVRQRIIIGDLLFTKVLGRAGTHPHGRGKVSIADVTDTGLNECVYTNGRQDTGMLVMSWFLTQPPLFLLPYLQEPFIPDVEQLVLGFPGQCHW